MWILPKNVDKYVIAIAATNANLPQKKPIKKQ